MRLTANDIAAMDERRRVFFINSLSGLKSVNLIGTANGTQQHNLAIVSSVVHIGSNPPLLAMMSRPHTVRRDTLENIHDTGFFTINHVNSAFLEAAHQTSARYDADQSEFDIVGLTPRISELHPAPYVAESALQIGLAHRQTIDLDINGSHMVIGEVIEVQLDEDAVSDDGAIDLGALGSLVVSGLDHYHATDSIARLSYAKPDQPLHKLSA